MIRELSLAIAEVEASLEQLQARTVSAQREALADKHVFDNSYNTFPF